MLSYGEIKKYYDMALEQLSYHVGCPIFKGLKRKEKPFPCTAECNGAFDKSIKCWKMLLEEGEGETIEEISKMTVEQYEKNKTRILKSLQR